MQRHIYNLETPAPELRQARRSDRGYKKALSIRPDYADAYNNMGIAFQDQGKLKEAIEAFNTAMRLILMTQSIGIIIFSLQQ